jgi:hypothetical protein
MNVHSLSNPLTKTGRMKNLAVVSSGHWDG